MSGVTTDGGGGNGGLSVGQINALIATALATLDVNGLIMTALDALNVAGSITAALDTGIMTHADLPNIHHTPPTVGGESGVATATRLPGPVVAMRLGWSQSQTKSAAIFTRANNHPTDGANSGESNGVIIPPFPPALNTDTTLYQWVWVAGDPEIDSLSESNSDASFDLYQDQGALTVSGVAGTAYVSTSRSSPPIPNDDVTLSLVIPGELIASRPWVAEQIAAIPAPAPAGGGFPTTRTQVFAGTLRNANATNLVANENWLGDQLYEIIVNNTNARLILTPPTGATTIRIGTPFENPAGATATPYAEIIFTVGATAVSGFQLHDVVANSLATVKINKLTS